MEAAQNTRRRGNHNLAIKKRRKVESSFFGTHIGGPIETNLGPNGGVSTPWPTWNPTSFRTLNVWGGVPPLYSYKQSVSGWGSVETASGIFDWSLFDLVWAKGVTDVLFAFNDIPTWAYSNGTFDLVAVGNWITAALTRARQNGLPIKFVEGINEADVPNSWGNGISGTVQDQVNIQKAIHDAARAFDPSIQVVSAPYNSLQAAALYFGAFLDAGGGQYCDIIAFHGYRDQAITSPSTYQSYWNKFSAMLAAKGQGNKPVWNTEFNALNEPVDQRVTWLAWSSFIDMSNGIARRFVYDWVNDGYQLWDANVVPNGIVNAAGIAYQQVFDWLNGATLGQKAALNGKTWTCQITRTSYQAIAAWTDDGSAAQYQAPCWAKQYRDLTGNVTVIKKNARIPLAANPVLIES